MKAQPAAGFQSLDRKLRKIMLPFVADLEVTTDTAGDYQLYTRHIMKNGKPLYFGAVRTGKQYTSFHLMPVYVHPPLLEGISPELRKRMHGKSCFNFTSVDDELITELSELTSAGFEYYRDQGYL